MTSYLIDVNVWLALTWELHPQQLFRRALERVANAASAKTIGDGYLAGFAEALAAAAGAGKIAVTLISIL